MIHVTFSLGLVARYPVRDRTNQIGECPLRRELDEFVRIMQRFFLICRGK